MLNEVVDALKTRADVYNAKLQECLSVCLTFNLWNFMEFHENCISLNVNYKTNLTKFALHME